MSELISIIIPVYNVENYLPKCIESVINQTYQEIEVILVDDGSTDSCPKICDEYSRRDSRIRVIHQENHGQGNARNVGMSIACGSYISFLDSDDCLEKNFVEILLSKAVLYNCDIVICNYRHIDEQGNVVKGGPHSRIREKMYSGIEAMEVALYWNEFGVAPWAKLFRKELWENARFKEDRIYEDLATTYIVYYKAKMVCFINEYLMNYRIRKNSDIHQPFNRKKLRTLDTADEILNFCLLNSKTSISAAKSRCVASACFVYFRIPDEELSKYDSEIKRCQTMIKSFRKVVIFDRRARLKTRLGALLSFAGFRLERTIFKLFFVH